MALHVDPEVGQAMATLAEAGFEAAPVGDWKSRRTMVDGLLAALGEGLPANEGVAVTAHRVPAEGAELDLRQYVAPGAHPAAAVVYLHGGGMISGTLDAYDRIVRNYAAQVPEAMFLAVEYRLAPEHPHPTPVEDCYDEAIAPYLLWSVDDNITGWGTLLGDAAGGVDVPSSAAPARERDLAGLPPTFEGLAPDAEVSRRANADRRRFLRHLAGRDLAG